jgi:hypothetical protein
LEYAREILEREIYKREGGKIGERENKGENTEEKKE